MSAIGPRRRVLLLCAGLALLKLAYLAQYAGLPFLHAPLFDSVVYLHQARSVRAGRFGDASLLAFSPLYGYFLALLGAGAGAWLVLPVLAQFALGTVNLCLIYRIGSARFGAAEGRVAGLLYLGYGALLFYESKLLSETLGLTLSIWACGQYLAPAFRGGRLGAALGCGATAGLAVLARASLLFCLPFFVLLALLPWDVADAGVGGQPDQAVGERPGAQRLRRCLGCLAGMALVLCGNGLWNQLHTGFFVPIIFVSRTISKTTTTEWRGNLADLSDSESGKITAWDVVRQAEARMEKARESVKAQAEDAGVPGAAAPAQAPPPSPWHIDVAGWLRGAPAKLRMTFQDLEINSYQYGYYGERTELSIYRLLPVSFGMLVLLGGVGAAWVVGERGPRALLPYLPLVLGTLATTTLFHPSSRYRLPLVIPLLILAGPAVLGVYRLRRRAPRLLAGAALALCCAGLMLRTVTYRLHDPAMYELIVAQAAVTGQDYGEALRRIQRARQLSQGDPSTEKYIHEVFGLPPGR